MPQASEDPGEGAQSLREAQPRPSLGAPAPQSEPLAGTAGKAGGLPGLTPHPPPHPRPPPPARDGSRGAQRGHTQLKEGRRTQWQLLCASRTWKTKQVPRLKYSVTEVKPNPGQATACGGARVCRDVYKLLRVSAESEPRGRDGRQAPRAGTALRTVGGGLFTEGAADHPRRSGRWPATGLFSRTPGSPSPQAWKRGEMHQR